MNFAMPVESTRRQESQVADVTNMGPVFVVTFDVSRKRFFCSKEFSTHRTTKGNSFLVHLQMFFQLRGIWQMLATFVTYKFQLFWMRSLMGFQIWVPVEIVATNVTAEGILQGMHSFVILKSKTRCERFAAFIALQRPLIMLHSKVSDIVTLEVKNFITFLALESLVLEIFLWNKSCN